MKHARDIYDNFIMKELLARTHVRLPSCLFVWRKCILTAFILAECFFGYLEMFLQTFISQRPSYILPDLVFLWKISFICVEWIILTFYALCRYMLKIHCIFNFFIGLQSRMFTACSKAYNQERCTSKPIWGKDMFIIIDSLHSLLIYI